MAALETALALADLAPDRTDVTVIAPNTEFVYRPMVIREPFAYGSAQRYPPARIVRHAGAKLLEGELGWIDPVARTIHTKADEAIGYDVLVLALGATVTKRYPHALTIDDRNLDETLHGLIQDIEGNYIHRLTFVAPGRMAWPLSLYELAMMTAGRAYDMQIELETTIVTPEDSPLAIFGSAASEAVVDLLAAANVETICSAYAGGPQLRRSADKPRRTAPGGGSGSCVARALWPRRARHSARRTQLHPDRLALPGPRCRVHLRRRRRDRLPDQAGRYRIAAGRRRCAVDRGSSWGPVTPERFNPVIHGMLLTNEKPQYLTAHVTGGHGFSSEITETPAWSPPSKIAAKYLSPYLEAQNRESTSQESAGA